MRITSPSIGMFFTSFNVLEDTMKIGNTVLLSLLPLWVVLSLLPMIWGQKCRSRRLGKMVAQRLVPLLLSNYSGRKQGLKNLFFLCAIALIGIALSAPKWGYKQEERYVKGVDLLIAVDVSKSMLAEDIKPNRLERTKLAILDLIKLFGGHRIGLIAFSGDSFLQCPLTLDHNAFIQSLDAIDTDTIPMPGTAINTAIELAEKVYDHMQNQKLLFLFSDGEELADSAIDGAKRAEKQNIHIYTIGIGSAEGTTIPIADHKTGKVKPLCDRNGQVVKTFLDEKMLQEIAKITDGQYYHLSPAALSHLQKDISTHFPFLKETSKENKYTEKVYHERYQLFLLPGLLLLLLEILIGTYKKPERYSVSIYYKLSLFAFAFLFSWNNLSAKESKGEVHYKNGEFKEALEFYDQQLKKNPNDRELLYNKGTSLLALNQYEEAVNCFKNANAGAPIELQKKIFYNLGNTLFEQGQNLPDPRNKREKWIESVRHFQSAVDLDGQFEAAKKNAKYVEAEIKKLEEQQKSNKENPEEQNDSQDQSQSNQPQDQNDPQNSKKNPEDQNDSQDQSQPDQPQEQNDPQNSKKNPEDQNDSQDQSQPNQPQEQNDPQNSKENPEDQNDSQDQSQPDQPQDQNDPQNSKENPEDQNDSQDQSQPEPQEQNDPQKMQENTPQDTKMTAGDAIQLLDSLESEEKKLPLKMIYGNIRNRSPEKFW
jgi:Ca-activated chloride channel family protein